MNIIDLSKYLPEDSTQDATKGVLNALKDARSIDKPTLLFPKGKWHFYPERAFEKHYFISNNDCGLKHIAFPLIGYDDITIDGNGSEFIIHGRMAPFIVDNSRNVTIKNFSVDAPIPFYGQGLVTDAGKDFVEIYIDPARFAGKVVDKRLVFETDEWENDSSDGLFVVEFDGRKNEPAYHKGTPFVIFYGKSKDSYFKNGVPKIEASQNGDKIRLTGNWGHEFSLGNNIYMGFEKRINPCIFSVNSENLALERINIYHSASMGIIAQLTNGITLHHVNIITRNGSDRVVSAVADATHFVNCTGEIFMEDCVFENMMDDATNIHGIYTTISEKIASNKIAVQFHHFQQWGIDIYSPGDRIYFVDRTNLTYRSNATVTEVEKINCQYTLLTLDQDLDSSVQIDDAVENPEKMPAVTLRRVKCGKNRSRGFLITTPGKVLIEDCEFHNSGHGIHFTGDANFWFESGPVKDVTVRYNVFNDAGYGYCQRPISFDPEIDTYKSTTPYHQNVTIENNLFICNSSQIFKAKSCKNLIFKNNKIKKSHAYEYTQLDQPSIIVEGCPDAIIEEPVEIKF